MRTIEYNAARSFREIALAVSASEASLTPPSAACAAIPPGEARTPALTGRSHHL